MSTGILPVMYSACEGVGLRLEIVPNGNNPELSQLQIFKGTRKLGSVVGRRQLFAWLAGYSIARSDFMHERDVWRELAAQCHRSEYETHSNTPEKIIAQLNETAAAMIAQRIPGA